MKTIKNTLLIIMSIMVIYGCEKDNSTLVETPQESTIETRNQQSHFSVISTETSGCCITIELGSLFNFNALPLGHGPAFYGFNFTQGTTEKLYLSDVTWEIYNFENGFKYRAFIEFCGEEGDEICINDNENINISGSYLFQPICFKAEGCEDDCGWYACWVEGNSEPVGIDFHSDLFVDLIVNVNGQQKAMSSYYPLPVPMGNCWSNTCDVYLDIVDWLTSSDIGYQGTISAVDGNYGCDKGGEDAPWGLFVYNNGMASIEVVEIVVQRGNNPAFSVPFKCMNNPF